MTGLPFDRVLLALPTGKEVLDVRRFMALPLHDRVRHVLQREVEFFMGPLPIDRRLALRALMQGQNGAAGAASERA